MKTADAARSGLRSALVVALFAGCVQVRPAPAEDFSLAGFATLALARSTEDQAEFVRDLSQPYGLRDGWRLENDSLFGIQANLRLIPGLEAVAQVVSRYRHKDSYDPELTWGFVRYEPSPSWNLRAGRMGTEFYMLADSRMVGYSYATVRPPVDYYGALPLNYFDGADLALVRPLAGGLLKAKFYAGMAREATPWGELEFDMNDSLLLGGHLDYFHGPWQFRLAHARLKFEHDLPLDSLYDALPPPTADELRVAGKWTSFTSFGLVYDEGPLQTQLMLSKTGNDHGTFQDAWAGYLVGSYRLGAWTPFLGLSAVKSDAKDLDYPVPGYTDSYQAHFYSDQHTLFCGLRWDFMANMSLKAQVDVIRADSRSRFLYRNEPEQWDGDMTVFTLAWDMVF